MGPEALQRGCLMEATVALREAPYALLGVGAVFLELYPANYFYDQGIVHLADSAAYLLGAFMFSFWLWPVALSGGFTVLLAAARVPKRETFRGVGGTRRSSHVFAECWFPLAGALVLALGWGLCAQPSASIARILFMGCGDRPRSFALRLARRGAPAWLACLSPGLPLARLDACVTALGCRGRGGEREAHPALRGNRPGPRRRKGVLCCP